MHPDRPTDPEPPPDPPNGYADRVRYHEAFEFAPDAQFLTDGYGLILQANHAAATLTGCPKEFLVDKPLGLLMVGAHRPRFYTCLTRLGRESAAETFETRMTRRGAAPRDVVATAYVWDGDQAGVSRTTRLLRWPIRDISAQVAAEGERAALLRRLVTSQEEERRRIARELHDSVGQYLAALGVGLHRARAVAGEAAAGLLDQLTALTREVGQEVHRLAVELRPMSLDDVGLPQAVEHYVERWSERAGVPAQFAVSGFVRPRLPWEVSTAVYRVIQEALTNVLKYAGATRVSVILEYRDDHLFALVEDDGRGFDPDAPTSPDARVTGGLGLVGMRERVTLLGGTFQIESGFGTGTTVFVRIPFPAIGGAT